MYHPVIVSAVSKAVIKFGYMLESPVSIRRYLLV